MSAWVPETEHVDVLLKAGFVFFDQGPMIGDRLRWFTEDPEVVGYEQAYATRAELRPDTASSTGQMLMQECVASVCHRYADDHADQYAAALAYRYRDPGFDPTVAEAFKTVHCFQYQSCEHPGWATSQAFALCEVMASRLQMVVPGYDEAPWGWDEAKVAARRNR